MAENALYNALNNYNESIENKYKQNWGSLLNFLGKWLCYFVIRGWWHRFLDWDHKEGWVWAKGKIY